MPAMCSILHHTPRHRKGWTTACKPSSSLFSCYSFQPYILIVHGVWPHCSSPISSLFMGYGHIFPALYPHCSRGMATFFQPYILIVHGVWTHFFSPISLLFPGNGHIFPVLYPHCSWGMDSLSGSGRASCCHVVGSCECSLPQALTRQSSEPVSPFSTYKPVIQCQ